MKLTKIAIIAFILNFLSACDSEQSQLKVYFKCGYVATNLGIRKAEIEIAENMSKYIQANNVRGSAETVMRLAKKFKMILRYTA